MSSVFQNILADLQKKFLKESNRCAEIAQILSEALHITITTEQIKYKGKVVTVMVAPTVKMSIRIKEEELKKLLIQKDIEVVKII